MFDFRIALFLPEPGLDRGGWLEKLMRISQNLQHQGASARLTLVGSDQWAVCWPSEKLKSYGSPRNTPNTLKAVKLKAEIEKAESRKPLVSEG